MFQRSRQDQKLLIFSSKLSNPTINPELLVSKRYDTSLEGCYLDTRSILPEKSKPYLLTLKNYFAPSNSESYSSSKDSNDNTVQVKFENQVMTPYIPLLFDLK